jgi:hypothetical protein
MTKDLLVEGWDQTGSRCYGFRRVARPMTAVRQAEEYILDRGATRVYIRRDGRAIGTYSNGFWRVEDEALQAALDGDR